MSSTPERILDSALSLFAWHGFAATSVRMIATEAGVSQGLLYNYFEGKEALLGAIFERSRADVQASFERARAGGEAAGAERLSRLIEAAFEIVRENQDFWRLSYQLRMQPEVLEGLGEDVHGWTQAIHRELEEVLGELGSADPAADALVLFAAIDGAAQHFVMDPDRYPLRTVATALTERFTQVANA
jgi:AcrR family transcriptional regulator